MWARPAHTAGAVLVADLPGPLLPGRTRDHQSRIHHFSRTGVFTRVAEEVGTHPDPIQLSPLLDTEAAQIYGYSSTT